MARIIIGSCMVRCPLGGLLSYALQFLKGFELLGHDIYYFEKGYYENACYDPLHDRLSDDCTVGVGLVRDLMEHYGMAGRWAFIDFHGQHYGLDAAALREVFRTADIFIDMGSFGSGCWAEEAVDVPMRVLYEGEPGYTQMQMEQRRRAGEQVDEYDRYYTVGSRIGTPDSDAPDGGQSWGHLWAVVATELFEAVPPPADAPFTTVMTWQSHRPIEYEGVTYYGQKDVEFEQFIGLPGRVEVPMELRVSGGDVPHDRLRENGWRIHDPGLITQPIGDYYAYMRSSAGEFSVSKSIFVKARTGWFGDRSGNYLASGRPVVMQDTGFSSRLPCGEGLFAVRSEEEAAEAIRAIRLDYAHHSKAARRIAEEHLDAKRVLRRFIEELS
jgi:hypothetical protein